MKKILALIMAAMLILSAAGCSKNEENNSDGFETPTSSTSSAPDNNDNNNSDKNYTLYDDLSEYVKVIFHEVYISIPNWEGGKALNGYISYDSNDSFLCVSYNVDEEYTGAIEDIVDDTYDEFTDSIGCRAPTASFNGYNLETKEKVTLDCGSEAMKFEGYLSANYLKDVIDYYVYGYSFVYDGATITVGAIIHEPEVIDAKKDTLKDIVDRMVKTVRTQP